MDDDSMDIHELVGQVVKAFNEQWPVQDFQRFLSKLPDVNASLVLGGEDSSISFNDDEWFFIVAPLSSSPQFTIFHLQLLLWMLRTRSDPDMTDGSSGMCLTALREQIMAFVSSGGDCDLPISGIDISSENNVRTGRKPDLQVDMKVEQATPKEFIFDLVQTHSNFFDKQSKTEPVRHSVASLLAIIKKATESSRAAHVSHSTFQRSVVSQRNDLLFSERLSDVTFVCPDGARFPAHQIVLSGESPYFDTFFTGPWSEQHEDGQWKTQIKSDVLKTALTYMYTGSLGSKQQEDDYSVDDMLELLQVGQEFQMANLVEDCCKLICPKLSLDNVKKITCVAATINFPFLGPTDLWKHCADFVRDNSVDVLFDQNFAALETENPDVWKRLRDQISTSRKRKAQEDEEAS